MAKAKQTTPEEDAQLLLDVNRKNIARKLAQGKTLRADEKALLEAEQGGGIETWAHNKVALAKALNISRVTLDKMLKRPGCPTVRGNGKYYVPEFKAFYRPDVPTSGSSEETPGNRKDMLICQGIQQRNDERLYDFQVKRGLYIAKTEIAESIKQCNEKVKGELLRRLLQTAPAEYAMVNGDEAECREINRRHLEETLAFLHTGDWNKSDDSPVHREVLQG